MRRSQSRKSPKRRKSLCKKRLSDKIRINMKEFKLGKFKSRQQALAVSYSQVSKKHPACKRILRQRSPLTTKTKIDYDTGVKKLYSVSIKPSTRKEKKFMAIFYDKNGNKVKTTHFGAKGYEDLTIHRDLERKARYITRHKKRENWKDPTSAGSLSRYILWQYPSFDKSVKYYKKKFNLK